VRLLERDMCLSGNDSGKAEGRGRRAGSQKAAKYWNLNTSGAWGK
jgi:hypothetical protein